VPYSGVAATTGQGFSELVTKFDTLKKEYFEVFLPEIQK
jgi:hypothetical protein